jgi:hypothetical protein
MNDLIQAPAAAEADLSALDRQALSALAEDGHGTIPEGADMERLDRLGLATRVGITWGLTAKGRVRLASGG